MEIANWHSFLEVPVTVSLPLSSTLPVITRARHWLLLSRKMVEKCSEVSLHRHGHRVAHIQMIRRHSSSHWQINRSLHTRIIVVLHTVHLELWQPLVEGMIFLLLITAILAMGITLTLDIHIAHLLGQTMDQKELNHIWLAHITSWYPRLRSIRLSKMIENDIVLAFNYHLF